MLIHLRPTSLNLLNSLSMALFAKLSTRYRATARHYDVALHASGLGLADIAAVSARTTAKYALTVRRLHNVNVAMALY